MRKKALSWEVLGDPCPWLAVGHFEPGVVRGRLRYISPIAFKVLRVWLFFSKWFFASWLVSSWSLWSRSFLSWSLWSWSRSSLFFPSWTFWSWSFWSWSVWSFCFHVASYLLSVCLCFGTNRPANVWYNWAREWLIVFKLKLLKSKFSKLKLLKLKSLMLKLFKLLFFQVKVLGTVQVEKFEVEVFKV